MKKLLVICQEVEKRMASFRGHLLNCVLLPIISMGIAVPAVSANQTPKPAELSENETKAFESMCKAFAESFLKGDEGGRVFCTGPGGVWVFEPSGEHVGTLRLPETPFNMAWGGADRRTLFFTARTSVYSMRMQAPGAKVPGGA